MTFSSSKLSILLASSVLTLGILAGCNPAKTEAGSNSANPPKEGSSTDANKPATSPSADLKVPEELKNDAYEYYGLGNTEPMKYVVKQNGQSQPGEITVKLTKVEGGMAEFDSVNSGALSTMGTIKLQLSKEGIKAIKMDKFETDPDSYELVTGLTKGKKWGFKLKLSPEVQLTGTNEVTGTESVTTPVGTYKDALVIKSVANGKRDGKAIVLTSTIWLAKGRGQVKTVSESNEGGKKISSTMEETK